MKASIWNALGDGLALVAGLLERATPEALEAAKGLVTSLLHAHTGTLEPAAIAEQLKTLRGRLAGNDAAALEQLAARFEHGKDGSS